MGLTFRDIKGSSLTIEEADGNFRYLTGSHEISGSLTISGSLLPSSISATLGSADSPWKEIFVSGSTITFVGSSSAHTASISMTPDLRINSSFTGSFAGDGSQLANVQNSNVDGAPYQYGEAGTGPIEPVLGDNNSTSNYATIGGGQLNSITSSFDFSGNETGSSYSFIGSGRKNQITGSRQSSILGGSRNLIIDNQNSDIIGSLNTSVCRNTYNIACSDFMFPLVIEGTETITASGSIGYNHINGFNNKITASVASSVNGFSNTIRKGYHSNVDGWFNVISTSFLTGSDSYNTINYSNEIPPPGYSFNNIGHKNTGYCNLISVSCAELNGGNKILDSNFSCIVGGGNVSILNSHNANFYAGSYPKSGSAQTDSKIVASRNVQQRGIYKTNVQIFETRCLGASAAMQNSDNHQINTNYSKIQGSAQTHQAIGRSNKTFRSCMTYIGVGWKNCIYDANNAYIVGSSWSNIKGYGYCNCLNSAAILCYGGNTYTDANRNGDVNRIIGSFSSDILTNFGQFNAHIGSIWSDIHGPYVTHAQMIGANNSCISGSSFTTILNGYKNCSFGATPYTTAYATKEFHSIIGSYCSSICTGYFNTLQSVRESNITSGSYNAITSNCCSNIFDSNYSSIGSGLSNNISSSNYSTIIGGQYNSMSHDDSFIIGSCLTSSYNCTTHVNNIFISGGLRDSSGDLGSSTQILSSTGTGTNWISLGAATNTTYILEVASGLGDDNAIITLSGSDETEDNVNIIGGTGIDVSVSGDDITITNDYALNLVAGPGVVINENGDNTEISASVNPDSTGSFYYSSSVVLNTITFFQGDGTTETITVDTGSGGGGGGDDFHHVYQSGSTGNNIKAILGSHINSGSYATIGGGSNNKIHTNGGNSFIGAGTSNITTGSNSFIGAGYNNCINSCGRCSAIVGGHDNNVFDDDSFIGGGHGNEVATSGNGQGWMTIGGGQFNCTGCGGAAVVGGAQNDALGCLSFIGGGFCNHANACYGVIGGGRENNISSLVCRASILGGASNTVSGSFSTILGGSKNTVKGRLSNITNGYLNNICGEGCYNFIGNGSGNEMDTKASSSFIGGGERNCVNAIGSFIGAGSDNQIEHANPNFTASNSVIVGGSGNCVANSGIIVGGSKNCIGSSGNTGFIGGGCNNTVNCVYAAILAGDSNQIVTGGISSVIVAGSSNKITDVNSFIGAGTKNTGSGVNSFIGGGTQNYIKTACESSILGGCANCIILSCFSNIGGGTKNLIYATGSKNSIVGGICNKISSSKEFEPNASAILGGEQNLLSHPYSFIMGVNIESDAPQTTFVNNFHATGSEGSENVVTFANLPTSDPENVGQLFVTQSDASGNLNGQYVLLVSQG